MHTHSDPPAPNHAAARLGFGSWIILIVLLTLLAGTCFVVYVGWTLEDSIEVSTAGYVAMAFGVLFSIVAGSGLMALIFYSSRSGYDEPPIFIEPETRSQAQGSSPAQSKSRPTRP
ncbi:hypothetical protein IVB14_06195 [Bradyrhizobium sp. 180]|uniref:hypothetical protein n=1 Tax=Bradyrhizobium sp. 180 TaxID=2782650 RepID=UPI001FF9D1D9|nr:hypothetical protein [Bradyrhizobium sp. 180]MCK1490027.1 hypothetical protein [Bradyrhizobium sp. 180]